MERYPLLDKINTPADLTYLGKAQLERLCHEIRLFLINNVAKTGGHLASNLGAVELTVALHKVFHSPHDQLVWDVGHQSYTHKILTGRKNQMLTLRQKDGISGFTKTKESIHDSFVSGHSSTSISVADGIAKANKILANSGHAIAIIGDGAFTGGMTLEGLNNAARGNSNLIVILNDNHMSISKNVGTLSRYLSKLRSNKRYFKLKDATKSVLGAIPVVGNNLVDVVANSKAQLKNVVYNTSFFEELGFVHMGPVDGHDLNMLCDVLTRAKNLKRPVFIHVETQKGKGYALAETNPGAYHGVSPFDPNKGINKVSTQENFSAVFGKSLTALAREDSRICAITAAMKYGTGLNHFSKEFRKLNRFFDVGIAEQHAVTFSAALASKGILPVFAVYSSFLQRAYDQILHDCAIEPRHMVFAIDRAGLVGEDGETHQGLFDCVFLSAIPGITIYSPATYNELELCLKQCVQNENSVCAVRYPRGAQPVISPRFSQVDISYTQHSLSDEKDLLLVTYGREYAEVIKAATYLSQSGVAVSVLKLTRIWPFDPKAVGEALHFRRILFVEEGMRTGGIAEHFLAALNGAGYTGEYSVLAVNGFVPQGTVEQQMAQLRLDCNGILQHILDHLTERKSS